VYGTAWAVILSALLLIAGATYWVTYPYRGLYDVPDPIQIDQPVIHHGELLTYTVHYCVDESLPLPLRVTRELQLQGPDEMIFPLAPFIGYQIQERCESRTLAIGVAAYFPEGTYHIHFTTELEVNPLRTIRQSFRSTDFRIERSHKIEEAAAEAQERILAEAAIAREKLKNEAKK
jgi:hypothetical protein